MSLISPQTGRQDAPSPEAPILPGEVHDLVYEAGGLRLLHDIRFSLAGGGVSALLGPNGAGKSLLLRLLHGLIAPTAGNVRWAGEDPQHLAVRRRQAMVFRQPALLRRSVRANLLFDLRAAGLSRREAGQRADAWLARTGLGGLAERPARVLSGGEQQRLALVRALARAPEVLLLDEPTANLDPAATLAVEELIALARADGCKVVLVTHDLAQARRLADDVLFLAGGHLLEHTPASRFFAAPETRAARDYVAGRLVLHGLPGERM